MNENIQLVNIDNSGDNFQLVTIGNQPSKAIFEFLVLLTFLLLCAGLVYFLRTSKNKKSPGDDFEIIE